MGQTRPQRHHPEIFEKLPREAQKKRGSFSRRRQDARRGAAYPQNPAGEGTENFGDLSVDSPRGDIPPADQALLLRALRENHHARAAAEKKPALRRAPS